MTELTGRVVSINRSRGGVPKLAVPEVFVSVDGLEGDSHVYHRHGGPDKAVCIYSIEVIEALQREGHPIAPGTTGENVTVSGLDWPRLVPGASRLFRDEIWRPWFAITESNLVLLRKTAEDRRDCKFHEPF